MKKPLLDLAVMGFLTVLGAGSALAEVGSLFDTPKAKAERASPFNWAKSGRKADRASMEGASGAKVIGGEVAADGAWPWHVALMVGGSPVTPDAQFCGGSLVLERWVLTAAHCVHLQDSESGNWADLQPQEVSILVGTNHLDGSGDLVPVDKVIRHPSYSGDQFDFDIALIKLKRAPQVPFKTVEVPDENFGAVLNQPGVKTIVTGWGLQNGGALTSDLRQAEIQMLDRAQCNTTLLDLRAEVAVSSFAQAIEIFGLKDDDAYAVWDDMIRRAPEPMSGNMICSGTFEGGMTSCNGDSGGPLVVPLEDGTYIQAGIVSWGLTASSGRGCEEKAIFSAYTNVSKFLPWLNEVLLAN